MIPAGYMLKKITAKPTWISAPTVRDIYSVSGCVSLNAADFTKTWRQNGYWLFNDPAAMEGTVSAEDVGRTDVKLFYYEVYDQEFDETIKTWSAFVPEASLFTEVRNPKRSRFEGFDITSFSAGQMAECSPLSCNGLASEIAVNEHCLLDTFESAKAVIEAGKLEGCEPGPYRILAVYTVEGENLPSQQR